MITRPLAVLAAALLLSATSTACAHVTETRTATVIAREPVRLDRRRVPEQDRVSVEARVVGRELLVKIERTTACLARWAVRERVLEETKRSADGTMLVSEAVAAIAGASMALSGYWASQHPKPGGDGLGGGYIMLMGIMVAVPTGIGAIVDAAAGSETSTLRTVVSPAIDEKYEPCTSGGAASAVVTLAAAERAPLVAITDADGNAAFDLGSWGPPGGASIDIALSVDGKVARLVRIPGDAR